MTVHGTGALPLTPDEPGNACAPQLLPAWNRADDDGSPARSSGDQPPDGPRVADDERCRSAISMPTLSTTSAASTISETVPSQ